MTSARIYPGPATAPGPPLQLLALFLLACLLFSCKKDTIKPGQVNDIATGAKGFISKIRFVNDSVGYAVGGSRYSFHEFLTTTDGGNSWAVVQESGGDHKALYGLANWQQKVYAVGYEGKMYINEAPEAPWQLIQAPLWALFQDLTFTSANRGYMVMGEGYHVGGIIRLDAAANFIRVDSFPYELSSVFFLNELEGFAGGYGAMLKTTDAGDTWELQNVKGDFFKGIYASDALNVWAVGFNGSIVHTADGGKNWTKQRNGDNPLLKPYKLRAVQFRNSLTGYVAGDKGILLKTTDGGKNWVEFEQFTGEDLRCLAIAPDGAVWVAGSNGAMFRITE